MIRSVLCALLVLFAAALPASADQNDPRLNDLFARLTIAPDDRSAGPISSAIRDIWRIYVGDSYDVVEFLNRGSRAALRGEAHLAELSFGGVIRRAPSYAEGWYQRGRLRLSIGDIDGALSDLSTALRLEPRHFDALAALGQSHRALSQPEQALAALRSALRIHPFQASALEQIAELRRSLGDPI